MFLLLVVSPQAVQTKEEERLEVLMNAIEVKEKVVVTVIVTVTEEGRLEGTIPAVEVAETTVIMMATIVVAIKGFGTHNVLRMKRVEFFYFFS